MAKSGIPYSLPVKLAKKHGRVECNQYDQHPSAIRWRAAIRRAVKKGLLRRTKGSSPSRSFYVPAEPKQQPRRDASHRHSFGEK